MLFFVIKTYSNKCDNASRTEGPVTLLNKIETVCAANNSIR